MPTNFSTLKNINDKFQSSANSTHGLGSYRMEDISEVNQTHNTNYPLLLIEPSTSTVENLNRGWEKHTFIAYMLEPDGYNDSTSDVEHYDSMQGVFSTFLDYLMVTRTGAFGGVSVNKKGMTIERVKNLGNDKLIGIKSTFEIDMPSALSEMGSTSFSLPTANLHAHFKTTSGVNVGAGTLEWDASNDNSISMEKSSLANDTDAFSIPAFSNVSNTWIYEGHAPHTTMKLPDFTTGFSSGDFSIFMLVKIKDDDDPVNRNLLTSHKVIQIDGQTTNDFFRLFYCNSGNSTFTSKIGVQVDSNNNADGSHSHNVYSNNGANLDSSPEMVFGEWVAIGLVNDATNGESRVYINNNKPLIMNNYQDSFLGNYDSEDLYIGAWGITSYAVSSTQNSMNGEMKDVIIYDAALNDKSAGLVNKYLMRTPLG